MKKVKLLVSALLLSASAMAQTYSTAGLTGYYKFDNANNLGAATTGSDLNVSSTTRILSIGDRNGNANAAVRFVGNISTRMNSSNTAFSKGSVTVASWVYYNQSAYTTNNTIAGIRYTALASPYNSYALVINVLDKKATFSYNNDNGLDNVVQGTTFLQENTWYHLVATYDSASHTAKVYVNGVLEGTGTTGTGALRYNNAPEFVVGNVNGTSQNWLIGGLDELYIYNRALTSTEIVALYNAVPTAIKTASFKALALYPSPSQRNITVSAIEKGIVNIYSMEGKLMLQTPVNEGENTLNIADLPAGMYMATVVSEGTVQRTQFIKE